MRTTMTTTWYDDTVRIRADWTQAAAPVDVEGEDGWIPAGIQAACGRRAAMRHVLLDYAEAEGCSADSADAIEAALDAMRAEAD